MNAIHVDEKDNAATALKLIQKKQCRTWRNDNRRYLKRA